RWTEDKTRAIFSNGRIFFNPASNWTANTIGCGFVGFVDPATGQPVPADALQPNSLATPENRASRCLQRARTKTSAPTWTLNLEYRPIEDVMIYAKRSRG
ncbi:MAG: hypothetical protein N2423_09200, partial [Novosphingobium sp.]|nr:hypothetical protein [Novosphingobium sp.]